jgi:hypothetical protein
MTKTASRKPTLNRQERSYIDGLVRTNGALIANEFTSRMKNFIRTIDGPRRDLNAECGYPETIETRDYHEQWKRNGVAKRVVTIEPSESWKTPPEVYEDENPKVITEFEKRWKEIVRQHNVWHYLKRADILSGVGHFGILIVGISDGKKLWTPAFQVDPVTGRPRERSTATTRTRRTPKQNEILYLKPVGQDRIQDLVEADLEQDTANARYGKPIKYKVNLGSPGKNNLSTTVHHTRALHLADGREDSDVWGTPRMEEVFNNVFDVRKVLGGSGEMFYKGGFPGISMELAPGAISQGEMVVQVDEAKVRDALERYMEGLQRYLVATGLTAKSLAPNIADPTPHLLAAIQAICIAKGIPVRIFMGSERGELASTQDKEAWNQRVSERQENYLTPMVILPFIEMLVATGVLPKPENLFVTWPDLNAPSDKDKADIGKTRMETLAIYAKDDVAQYVGDEEAMVHIMGMPDEVAKKLHDSGTGPLDAEDKIDLEIKKVEGAEKAKKKFGPKPAPPPAGGNGRVPARGRAPSPNGRARAATR